MAWARLRREAAGSDEHALGRAVAEQCAGEVLVGRRADRIVLRVVLNLYVDWVVAEHVLADDAVDPAVAGAA